MWAQVTGVSTHASAARPRPVRLGRIPGASQYLCARVSRVQVVPTGLRPRSVRATVSSMYQRGWTLLDVHEAAGRGTRKVGAIPARFQPCPCGCCRALSSTGVGRMRGTADSGVGSEDWREKLGIQDARRDRCRHSLRPRPSREGYAFALDARSRALLLRANVGGPGLVVKTTKHTKITKETAHTNCVFTRGTSGLALWPL